MQFGCSLKNDRLLFLICFINGPLILCATLAVAYAFDINTQTHTYYPGAEQQLNETVARNTSDLGFRSLLFRAILSPKPKINASFSISNSHIFSLGFWSLTSPYSLCQNRTNKWTKLYDVFNFDCLLRFQIKTRIKKPYLVPIPNSF